MRTRTAVAAALLLALPSLPSAAADNRFTGFVEGGLLGNVLGAGGTISMGRLGVCGGVSLAGEDPTWWNVGLTCALRPGSGDSPFIDLRYGPAIKFGLGGMYGARKTYAYSNGFYRMSASWYPALDLSLSLALVFR